MYVFFGYWFNYVFLVNLCKLNVEFLVWYFGISKYEVDFVDFEFLRMYLM